MHSRRLACFLLGLWLSGGLFVAWVATENFGTVDRILSQPDPAATLRIRTLGKDQARLLLRYEASEMNRHFFEVWEVVQIVGGAFFFFYLLFGTSEGKIPLALALTILTLVLVQRFMLTPEIVAMGRLMDFGPRVAGDEAKFQVMHSAYVGVEIGKWVLQMALAVMLILYRGRPSGNAQAFTPAQKPMQTR